MSDATFHFSEGDRVLTPSGKGTVVGFSPPVDEEEPQLAAVWVELDRPRTIYYPREWFTEHEEVETL